MAVACADGSMRVFDRRSEDLVLWTPAQASKTTFLGACNQEKYLCQATDGNQLKIWDVRTFSELRKLNASSTISCVKTGRNLIGVGNHLSYLSM